jgi:hypothetical protein
MRLDESVIGVPIFTQDGSRIGTMKEIRGRFFKVDAPFQPDYWLTEDHIASAMGSEVRLSFTEDRIGDYKLGDPEEAGYEEADVTAVSDGFTADRASNESFPDVRTRGEESNVRAMGTQNPVVAWEDVVVEYREYWTSRHGAAGGAFEDHEPGYRYGHEMAHDPRYVGREWTDMEPELRQNYGDWSREHGYRGDDNQWERIREPAREAMHRGRMRRAA